jgi:hypothetical protein
MGVLKSEAIKKFLEAKSHSDLAKLYHKGMEVQVNAAMDEGRRIEMGGPGTKSGFAFTDGIETWRAFRIPKKAMSEPEDNDGGMTWNLEKHVEGIGMTGWNWQEKKSLWVAYDFDSMMGHSEKHQKKLNEAQLLEVQKAVTDLPFVTLRRSTSGKGLHLYIYIEGIETATHTEHAALARAILSHISGLTGFNFADKVDICGGNMWVWHRKMLGTNGLTLIREGGILPASKIPTNWRDHLNVISRKTTRLVPKIEGVPSDTFLELSGCRSKVVLTQDHLKLINWLNDRNCPGWWDSDNHMLITHTYHLREAFEEKSLGIKGEFTTVSSGRESGFDINCFMFPMKNGAWAVRRYGMGTQETKMWIQDGKGWTRCYFNRELTLDDVARMYDAVELEHGGYQFPSVEQGKNALLKLGITIEVPNWITGRAMKVREARQDYKILVMISSIKEDAKHDMKGWLEEKNYYRRLFNNPIAGTADDSFALGDFDDIVRHIISENGEELGWVINTDEGSWIHQPIHNVKLFLVSKGIGKKDIDIILGRAVNQAWRVVNKPFEPEYPGDRQWNRSSARFKIAPTLDGEALSFPTWQRILVHCGKSLDAPIAENQWCKANGVMTGADYLRLWFASLIRFPQQPLPYLALYGPQDSGKSTLHEAFCQLILDGGYMDGATALESQGGFNGELQDTILCTLEEVDLRNKRVYAKVKDWVTSAQISIHVKGLTPAKAPNYTHWIQCVNDRDFIPVFPGDTRLTVLFVDSIPNDQKIPKRDLWTLLQKEAPDFLAALLATDIPDSKDRLMVPCIKTVDKVAAEYSSMNPVEQFFTHEVKRIDGAYINLEDLYQKFIVWLGPEESIGWGKIKFSKSIPQDIPKGRVSGLRTESGGIDQMTYVGNVSFKDVPPTKRWMSTGIFMRRE